MNKLKIASLFAGCGGTDIGFLGGFSFLNNNYKKHPTELIFANDNDPRVCDIFDDNFQLKVIRKDINKVQAKEIPDHDILTAGFPCQSFSIVAQNPLRLGVKDPKGELFFEVCKVLKDKQPLCFVAENVKGILSVNNGLTFPLIMKSFRDCGYHLVHILLNAYHYGIPQRRERVFIVGFKRPEYLDLFCPPPPVNKQKNLKANPMK